MSSPTLDRATYEHKRFLLQVSSYLKQKDSKQIVYLEDLPRELEDKEPWEVLAQLQVRGKSTPEELVRILKDINRHDAAEKVKKLTAKKKAAVTRKDSGLKFEESLQLTSKNGDVLVEQIAYLELAAEKGGRTRIKEVVSEAKIFQAQVQRKLKYASGLLNSVLAAGNENVQVTASNSSPSPTSSPESSLTGVESSAVPRSLTRQHTKIKDSELQQAAKRLKPALGIRGSGSPPRSVRKNGDSVSNNSHKTGRQPSSQPPSNGVQNKSLVTASVPHPVQVMNSNEEEDIYTLPGPPATTFLSASQTDVQYYNLPPLITRKGNQLTASTSLATGYTKSVKATVKKPATSPKPIASNKGSQDTSTGDSGFSDSRAFLKETTPLSTPDDPVAKARAQQVFESQDNSTYASLIKSEVVAIGSECYKTLRDTSKAVAKPMKATQSV